jgi:predicted transcriptional regulator
MNEVDYSFTLAEILSSPKRVMILHFLKEAMSYSQLMKEFRKNNVRIGASEFYKHVDILINQGCVVKKGNKYFITSRGSKIVKFSSEIMNVKTKEPRVKLEYE